MESAELEGLIAQLKRARGTEFVRLFRQADTTIGDQLRQQVSELKERQGKGLVVDVPQLALKYGLTLKTTFRMLEGSALPSGLCGLPRRSRPPGQTGLCDRSSTVTGAK